MQLTDNLSQIKYLHGLYLYYIFFLNPNKDAPLCIFLPKPTSEIEYLQILSQMISDI